MGEWLESLVPWGTEFLIRLQSYTPDWMVAIFAVLTFMGNEEFYLFLLPVVYWAIDREIGIRLGYLSLLSAWINSVFKHLFAIPRPAAPQLDIPYPVTDPSFPSGHAQGAVVNWAYLAYRFRNRIFRVISVIIILGIGLSRLVLGVHFPQDVLGGWIIGLGVLLVYIWLEEPVGRWIADQRTPVQVLLAVGVPLILIFLHPADPEGLYPVAGSVTPMSALAGLGVGLIMERAWVRFRVEGEWWRRVLRFLLGLGIVAALYVGPRLILPEEMDHGVEVITRMARYALVGWAVSFLAPWLFVRLRLAGQEEDQGR
ncbi:MAG: phosphatase PAP2 family protein [Anaerolineae bacterium]